MFDIFWNILILAVGCFTCTCAGAAIFRRAAGEDFLKQKFDRVETLCVEFLTGSGALGTVWLILALLPGEWLGLTTTLVICAAAVFLGARTAWRDIKLAWIHIKIIVTHPHRETDISVKILHWLILAGLAVMFMTAFLPPDNYKSVSEFLVAKQIAYNNGLTMSPGTEPFVAGGLLAEMNLGVLMLFGGTMATGVLGFIYLLAGMMLVSGVGRRVGLNYMERWLLALVLAAWGVSALQGYGNLDAFASCGMAIAAFVIISEVNRTDRNSHILAGLLIAWAVMVQYMQAAVLLPAMLAFAFSVFSRQQQNPSDGPAEETPQPAVMRRIGWLLAPLGAMLILWLLKNVALYHALLPVQPDNPFTAATFLSVATLPFMLLLVICLKRCSGNKLVIGKFNFAKPVAFMWQLLAFIIILNAISNLTSLNQNISTGLYASNMQASDFIRMGKSADPEKDRVFTMSPYIYFMDDRFIASSSSRKLLRELCDRSDMDKWRELWTKNFRVFYLTDENTAFSRDGKNFVFRIRLDDGRTFTLDSNRLPPELGLDPLCLGSICDKYASCGYKLVIRENAIIPEDLAPVKN